MEIKLQTMIFATDNSFFVYIYMKGQGGRVELRLEVNNEQRMFAFPDTTRAYVQSVNLNPDSYRVVLSDWGQGTSGQTLRVRATCVDGDSDSNGDGTEDEVVLT